jgi:glutamate/tyrosine decarboxylase-like PLP-dependent enzyme
VLDPIAELSEMARARHLGFHADACLGGFVLPFAAELGRHIPAFDFSLPGVTSMSADPHKYGYAPKGTSVVLYRGRELRRHQYFTAGDWPGGLYYSPTLSGSRPGGLSAAAWAAMASMGKEGYLDATTRILEAADRIKEGIGAIEGLEILGDPLWVIAFTAGDVDVFRLLEAMTRRGWRLNGLHHPPAIHLAVTLRHATAGGRPVPGRSEGGAGRGSARPCRRGRNAPGLRDGRHVPGAGGGQRPVGAIRRHALRSVTGEYGAIAVVER